MSKRLTVSRFKEHVFGAAATAVVVLLLNLLAVRADVSQNFQDAANALRTNDCYGSASFSATATDAVNGVSARSSQLTNPANPALYNLPFINFQTGATLAFQYKLNAAAAGSPRSLTVELYSAADNTATTTNNPLVLFTDATLSAATESQNLAVGVTGVYRVRFVAAGSGGSARVILDDITVTGGDRSIVGSLQTTAVAVCNAVIPSVTPPTANPDSQSVSNVSASVFSITANDAANTNMMNVNRVDLNPTTSIEETTLTVPQGTFTVAGGVLTFTPNTANFTAAFSISYTVKDSAGATSNAALVTLSPPEATTAAVSVSGRITNEHGRGAARAVLILIDDNGTERTIQTNFFGYFRFTEIEAGRSYVLNVAHKRYRGTSVPLNVSEQIDDLAIVLTP